ncbi:hypothetical protein [Enterovibrio norvegicus]|uniref:hypothetical protein n=1 Tax=Enterovibrio norvegicus TaxID=188144 RepID=UPI00352D7AA9
MITNTPISENSTKPVVLPSPPYDDTEAGFQPLSESESQKLLCYLLEHLKEE